MPTEKNSPRGTTTIPLLFFLAFFWTGCSQIREIPRDQLVENLAPILEVEERANLAMRGIEKLARLGEIRDKDMKVLKEHYDVYYVHHKAASVFLAQGDIKSYESHVDLAKKELESMEKQLKTLVRHSSF